MRYAKIRKMDISNGLGVGVSLFTQGCHFHCKNCFNKETWDFKGGQEFTAETFAKILELLDRPGISRFSILGGEPLEKCNLETLSRLCSLVKNRFPNIKIWLYTGYVFSETFWDRPELTQRERICLARILEEIDVLVDGPFVEEQKDIAIPFAGSWNQRVIDLKATRKNKKLTKLNIDKM